MDDAANIWDNVPDWGGVGARRLVRLGGGLGASIWEIHPGGDYWRHFHHASDELLVVLRGRPAVETPDGRREPGEGDVLSLPHGPQGDRTITNDTSEVVRVLIISTNTDPDVAEYLDTGKVGEATTRVSFASPTRSNMRVRNDGPSRRDGYLTPTRQFYAHSYQGHSGTLAQVRGLLARGRSSRDETHQCAGRR